MIDASVTVANGHSWIIDLLIPDDGGGFGGKVGNG